MTSTRRWGSLLGFGLLLVQGAGCGGGDSSSATFATTFTVQGDDGAIRTTFEPGETITLALTVRNRTDQPQTIEFATPQIFEFQVARRDADRPLWTSSSGAVFAQILTTVLFGPRETKVYSVAWRQVDDTGAPVGSGAYGARGNLVPLTCPGCAAPVDPRLADVHRRGFTVH